MHQGCFSLWYRPCIGIGPVLEQEPDKGEIGHRVRGTRAMQGCHVPEPAAGDGIDLRTGLQQLLAQNDLNFVCGIDFGIRHFSEPMEGRGSRVIPGASRRWRT